MMKARLESYHDAKTELSPVPTAASIPTPLDKKPVIYCLKESPILDCIHGEKVSLIADVIDREYFVHSESTVDSLRIGPLPEDWFVEPAALQIKFNGLVSSLPARTKGAETDLDNLSSIDVIAYDSDRSIYVEFPTLADAMAFIDRWIDMAAMPPPGLESTSCNVFD
ncbi:hypothetical protein BDP27DRAFT_1309457 [Rhodocollybia butyracea]|uniref:Uncharacterized protein n=1 Tax=Rhodocollybia butyracea TaxID=206335 RepID=A0A9P5QA35_9AGAR|nr:hypothetical protein BDP27DRAFT_1309457 [Rhodocollybia butyracea]